ncbi:MAG: ATPase [Methanocalculus sp. MSAO_Arc1]|uniref:AAA family ATPase n=1 Tax=Methanocalculus TaxID=71151 RepID=UPI000FF4C373|nr:MULTISPECIES: AAA family ATPase [unclassified Methanocalculus]MCP1662106.1 putative ATPase [Methanocalculus sp. AMF5]RQD80163.1 MAG: ATPase [Methanocalculus sp. MSAO_Arc1]
MRIKQVSCTNFKSFSDLSVDLDAYNILIGTNAAGKTNFIRILRFFRDIARHGLGNAISLQGGAEYIQNTRIPSDLPTRLGIVFENDLGVFRGVRDTNGNRHILTFNGIDYTFSLGTHEGGYHILDDRLHIWCSCRPEEGEGESRAGELVITHTSDGVFYELNTADDIRIDISEIIPPYLQSNTPKEGTLLIENPLMIPLPGFQRFFADIAIYDFDPRTPRKAIPLAGRSDLEEDGSNLTLVLKTILADPEKKRRFSNLMQDLLPFVRDVDVRKFMDSSIYFTVTERYGDDQTLPSSVISDGTVNVINLICALYFDERPFIVIEEPEKNIHPYLIGKVVSMFADAARNKQILITTHNPGVVRHADIEDILLISRDADGFSVISKPAYREEVRTFLKNEVGLEELYIQNLLGL